MSANLTIRQAQMVLPDRVVTGDLVIENGIIVEVAPKATRPIGEEIHASGLIVLLGSLMDMLFGRASGPKPFSRVRERPLRVA